MTTGTKMKLAGNHRTARIQLLAIAGLIGAASLVQAQSGPSAPLPGTPAPAANPLATSDPESSLTLQQIVARQEDHFAKLQNVQGTAVHSEIRYNEQGQALPPTVQYIFFAYEGADSVTLAMPKAAAQAYKSSQGQVPWPHITSAFLVAGETVYTIRKPDSGSSVPKVLATPFNPAVHENNPLVSFHPRQISDEQIALRDLARAIPNMAQRPKVYDVTRDGKPLVKVDFANPNTPGERLYYLLDPGRGYLPVEIARTSNGRALSLSKIVIGHTPEGIWIPARRERVVYTAAGKQASRQTWHFEYFSANKKLAPKTLTLMYFNLPLNTPVTVVNDGTAQRKSPAAQPSGTTPSAQRQPATLVPTATPIPPRIAPAPRRVPLQ